MELGLDTLEKRRTGQDMSLAYKIINEERFQGTSVLSTVGDNVRTVTWLASEPKNLVTQLHGQS